MRSPSVYAIVLAAGFFGANGPTATAAPPSLPGVYPAPPPVAQPTSPFLQPVGPNKKRLPLPPGNDPLPLAGPPAPAPDLNWLSPPATLGKKKPSFLPAGDLLTPPPAPPIDITAAPAPATDPGWMATLYPGKKRLTSPAGAVPGTPVDLSATAPVPFDPGYPLFRDKKRLFAFPSSGTPVTTPAATSTPVVSPAATADLTEAAKRIRGSVFMLTAPRYSFGTGVLISRTHRLVATNVHIAEFHQVYGGKMIAIRNGTDTVYEVERVWYHPGVKRILDWPLVARSVDPADGGVYVNSPDVAVVQLKAGGPELPEPVTLAGPDDYSDLMTQEVGMLGFPWHDNMDRLARPFDRATATFHAGRITRVTDYQLKAGDKRTAQFLQHTLTPGEGGTSGSAIFTASGKVVAFHNSSRPERWVSGRQVELIHGVRVDALYELLALHDLDRPGPPMLGPPPVVVPMPVHRDDLLTKRYREADPESEKARRTFANVREVRQELDRTRTGDIEWSEYDRLTKLCDEAIRSSPDYYAPPRVLRAAVAVHRGPSVRASNSLINDALVAAREAVRLTPGSPEAQLILAEALVRRATRNRDHDFKTFHQTLPEGWEEDVRKAAEEEKKRIREEVGEAVEILAKLLAAKDLDARTAAHVHRVHAVALASVLEKYPEAIAECNRAIELKPDLAILYALRADLNRMAGKHEEAKRDDRAYRERGYKGTIPNPPSLHGGGY